MRQVNYFNIKWIKRYFISVCSRDGGQQSGKIVQGIGKVVIEIWAIEEVNYRYIESEVCQLFQ